MAFSSYHGISQIDGVRVKISDRFKPPPQVTLPVDLDFGNPSDILFTEYDFTNEERYISWVEARKAEEAELERLHEEQRLIEEQRLKDEKQQELQTTEEIGEQVTTDESNTQDSVNSAQHAVEHQIKDNSHANGFIPNSLHDVHATTTIENSASNAVISIDPNKENAVTSGYYPSSWAPNMAPTVHTNSVTSTAETMPFYSGTSILTPQPIQNPAQHVNRQISGGSFDYAQFEKEEDIFDRVELSTLNVMDELNKVLQTAQASSTGVGQNTAPSNATVYAQPSANSVHSVNSIPSERTVYSQTNGVSVSNNVVTPNTLIYVTSAQGTHNTQVPSLQNKFSSVSSDSPAFRLGNSAMDSVNFNPKKESCSIGHPERVNGYISNNVASSATAGHTQKVNSDSRTWSLKHVDYPELDSPAPEASIQIGKSGVSFKSSNSTQKKPVSQTNSYPVTYSATNAGYNNSILSQPIQQVYNVQDITYLPSQNSVQPQNSSNSYGAGNQMNYMTDFEKIFGRHSLSKQYYNTQKNNNNFSSLSRDSSPVALKSSLRSARSVPDLTALNYDADGDALQNSNSRTPPASRSRTPTEMFTNPSHKQNKKQHLSDRTSHESRLKFRQSSGPAVVQRDPYNQLSLEARQLVNNITDMGFPRARVSRAVEQFGLDDKQVLDYMLLVSKFSDGNSEADVEQAVRLSSGQPTEVGQYLHMLKTFRELGFSDNRIKIALKKHGLNEEDALNELVAS